jgi:hypothetical protein
MTIEIQEYCHSNKFIGQALGWSVAKVKTTLVKNDLLYTAKETTRAGTTIYKTVLNRPVVKYIIKNLMT